MQGSVRDLLDDQVSPLSWPQRVQIAVGAAWGLRYLHDYFDPPFIHRDFKTSNILVTEHGKVGSRSHLHTLYFFVIGPKSCVLGSAYKLLVFRYF